MSVVSKINGIPVVDTKVTGFTFDGINTHTINDNEGNSFTTSMTSISATTISATTFYGDGSQLTNVGGFNNFIVSDGSNTQTIEDGNTLSFLTNSGLTFTVSATDNVTLDYNLTGMTAEATPASGDKLLLWDNVSQSHKNIDWDDLPGAGGGEANTASNVGGANGIFYQKSGVIRGAGYTRGISFNDPRLKPAKNKKAEPERHSVL